MVFFIVVGVDVGVVADAAAHIIVVVDVAIVVVVVVVAASSSIVVVGVTFIVVDVAHVGVGGDDVVVVIAKAHVGVFLLLQLLRLVDGYCYR